MSELNALLVGESWQTIETHVKGFDTVDNAEFETNIEHLEGALNAAGIATEYQPSHVAATEFPATVDELSKYDVVVLSDVGRNTLELVPETYHESTRTPNRLWTIDEYVRGGGGFIMVGGHMSFQGFNGKGNYRGTGVESALPVSLDVFDDRVETPSGVQPAVDEDHPVTANLPSTLPDVLGYNHVTPDEGAVVPISVNGDPFVAVDEHEDGRSAAFTTDCAPHWAPSEFLESDEYQRLWANLVEWVTDER